MREYERGSDSLHARKTPVLRTFTLILIEFDLNIEDAVKKSKKVPNGTTGSYLIPYLQNNSIPLLIVKVIYPHAVCPLAFFTPIRSKVFLGGGSSEAFFLTLRTGGHFVLKERQVFTGTVSEAS